MLLEQFHYKPVMDLTTAIWLVEFQNVVCLVTWVVYYIRLHVKIFLHSIFISIDFWKSMSCIVLDKELTEKIIIKELGLLIDSSPQGFSFCPPKTFKHNKQTEWNTGHLHGSTRSSRKMDYDDLFAVFCDIKVKNAGVFAIGVGKCRL